MNKYIFLEYLLDFVFLLLLYFCKPFAKIIVNIFYPILSSVTKNYDILSIIIFFVPLLIFMFINKLIFKLIKNKKNENHHDIWEKI